MEALTKVRHFVSWHRRGLAALLAALGMLILVIQLNPNLQPGAPVVASTQPLAAGQTLAAEDLKVIRLPLQALPEEPITSIAAVEGKELATSLGGNTIIQPGMLQGKGALGPGRSLVPVELPDERLMQVLSVGAPLALVSMTEDGATVLTDDAILAQLPNSDEAAGLSAAPGRNPLALIEVEDELAADVAVLGQRGELSVIVVD